MLTEELEKRIRSAVFSLTNVLIENIREKAAELDRRVKEYPEEFSKEFLHDYYKTDRE